MAITRCLFQFVTYCMLIGLSHESSLIGENVREAKSDEFLFAVSIAWRAPKDCRSGSMFRNRHFCTGTLISRKSVLTNAHCIVTKEIEDVVIFAGSEDVSLAKKYYPESWLTYDHWKYGVQNIQPQNDIAIITLKDQGVQTPKITPAFVRTLAPKKLYNTEVKIAGWGESEDGTTPLVLKTAVVTIISNEECSLKITLVRRKPYSVPKQYMCSVANPWVLSSCGDSGAPILNAKNQLVGINSGVCPKLSGPRGWVHQNQVNSHLNLYYYGKFIELFKS